MSYDAKSALASTATGAAAGSMFGPWGTAIGAGGGFLIDAFGQLFGGGDDPEDAERKKMEAMQKAAADYGTYRGDAQQMREQGLKQQLSAYGGAANAMNLMYGANYDPRNYAPNLGENPYARSPDAGAAAPQGAGQPQGPAQIGAADMNSYGGRAASWPGQPPPPDPRYAGASGGRGNSPASARPVTNGGGRY